MGFNTGGTGGSIATSSDVALSSLASENILSYDTAIAKWKNVNVGELIDGGGSSSTSSFVSTKSVPDLQALSGTDTDATDLIQALCDANEYVVIDGDFVVCSASHLELDDFDKKGRTGVNPVRETLIKELRLSTGSRLRIGGPFTIRRRGGWQFNEQIGGTRVIPEHTKELTALTVNGSGDPAKYAVGDWLYVCSNDPQTNLTGSNYYGSIRKVDAVGDDGRVILNAELNRTFSLGRNNFVTVTTATTASTLQVVYNPNETLTVGQVVDVWSPGHTLLAVGRTVSAIGSNTVSISGGSVTVTPGAYFTKTSEGDGHVGAPWTVKLDMMPAFRLHLESHSSIQGVGYRNPSLDGTQIPGKPSGTKYPASNTMILFELCLDTWISGEGTIGDHPRQATQFSGCVGGGVSRGMKIWKVFNTGSAGYLINISGGCVGTRILADSLTYGRHGVTTNVGGDMYLSFPSAGASYKSGFLQRNGNDDGLVKMGGVGEPEFLIYDPLEVAYNTAHAMDTHRSGYGVTYIINNVHDNAGGVNIRSDAARVIGHGTVRGGYDRSVVAVSEEVDIPTFLSGVKVSGIRASASASDPGNEDFGLFKFAGPFYAVDCVAEHSDAPQGTAVFFDEKARGDLVNMKINNVDEAFRSRGSGVRIIDAKIGPEVPTVFTPLGVASTIGLNAIISSSNLKPPVPDGGTGGEWFFNADNGTDSADDGVMNSGQQYATPFTARRGWFSSLAVGVQVAGASGCDIELGIYASDAFGNITDNKIASGRVAGDTTGTKKFTLSNRIQAVEGAIYWVAALATGGSPQVRRLNLGLGGTYEDIDTALQQPGIQITRTGANSTFVTWKSNTSYNSTAIKIIVGMAAKGIG
jgi:hypothetical protein